MSPFSGSPAATAVAGRYCCCYHRRLAADWTCEGLGEATRGISEGQDPLYPGGGWSCRRCTRRAGETHRGSSLDLLVAWGTAGGYSIVLVVAILLQVANYLAEIPAKV